MFFTSKILPTKLHNQLQMLLVGIRPEYFEDLGYSTSLFITLHGAHALPRLLASLSVPSNLIFSQPLCFPHSNEHISVGTQCVVSVSL